MITWIKPSGIEEHDEIVNQLDGVLKHGLKIPLNLCAKLGVINDRELYRRALAAGLPQIMSKALLGKILSQSDSGNLDFNFEKLDTTKRKRVEQIFTSKDPKIKMPIFLHNGSNHWWIMAGNTRTSYCYNNNIELKALVLKY